LAATLSEEVVDVWRRTDRLFSFVVTRHPSFSFEDGQLAMIGLELDGKTVDWLRARTLGIGAARPCPDGRRRACLLIV
jgi:ferredoxin-NADP reductase